MMMWRRHLDLARRHLSEGQARVERQMRLIAELQACGQPTDLAEQLLASMEETLEQMRAHRDHLEAHPPPR